MIKNSPITMEALSGSNPNSPEGAIYTPGLAVPSLFSLEIDRL